MRYWGLFVAKVSAAFLLSAAMLSVLNAFWQPRSRFGRINSHLFGYDLLYTSLAGIVFLLSVGLFTLSVIDQRYRCRTCARRLRMPVLRGSWSFMLQLGRPELEYICPYGHGKLNVAELQISGIENPQWKSGEGDFWQDLCAAAGKSEPED